MKLSYKIHWQLILLILMFAFPSQMFAYSFEVDGIYYNKIGNNECAVYCKEYGVASYSGSIIIPKIVTYDNVTYVVTSIENNAFAWCYNLTSIEIPNTVTKIGSRAFSKCRSLTSIEIPNLVTKIGIYAFGECLKLRTLFSYNPVPPTCAAKNTFAEDTFKAVTLYVSNESVDAYKSDSVWMNFNKIKATAKHPTQI